MGFTNTFLTSVGGIVIGGSFQFGYNIAVCDSASKSFWQFFDKNQYGDYWSTWVVSTFALGALAGSFFTGPAANKFGVRGIFMPINIVSFLSCACIWWSSTQLPEVSDEAKQTWLDDKNDGNLTVDDYRYSHVQMGESFPTALYALGLGRILIGIFAGMASGSAPRYIMEISPKDKRGMIGVLNQLLITVGIMVAQIFGFPELFGDSWMLCFCLPSLLSVLLLVMMMAGSMVSDSPRDMLIRTDDVDKATATMMKLRKTAKEVEDEIQEIQQEMENSKGQSELSIMQLVGEKGVRFQVLSMVLMHMCQQLGGINAVFFYAGEILKQVGLKPEKIQFYTFGLGFVNVLMTVVSTGIIEKTGRKVLMTVGFSVMVLADVLLVFNLPEAGESVAASSANICYAFIVAYIVGFAIGPGPVPWMYNTELFEQNTRSAASMLGCMTNWFCCALVGAFFMRIQASLQQYVFMIFAGVGVVAVLWLMKFIPETKNQTFTAIYNAFADLNGVKKRDDESVPLKETGKV